MRFHTLDEWLAWQETLHPRAIDLGLERCRAVAARLGLLQPGFPVLSVAGTNGKGSCTVFLDGFYRAAGYRTGRYMSPHLLRYTERICLSGQEIGEARLCRAFAEVDAARGEVSLTYFEFGTLAAMLIFQQERVEVAVLEVGLGGRLDAVNLWDADVALITALDVDHAAWLGPDRETIAREKAGVFRPGRPAVCADPRPPASLLRAATALGTPLYCLDRDFRYTARGDTWDWSGGARHYSALPLPGLAGFYQLHNASAALQAAACLEARLPLPENALREGLRGASLPGRFQVLPGRPTRILDVAHNPLGARVLAEQLRRRPCAGRTHALVGMLGDKDIPGTLRELLPVVDAWHVAPLDTPRAAPPQDLERALRDLGAAEVRRVAGAAAAYRALCAGLPEADRLVVFGSFYTVAAVLALNNSMS